MRFEFNQGIPEGCVDWLNENVGKGEHVGQMGAACTYLNDLDWFYERVQIPVTIGDAEPWYVPTITVKDEKKAMLFALRWA